MIIEVDDETCIFRFMSKWQNKRKRPCLKRQRLKSHHLFQSISGQTQARVPELCTGIFEVSNEWTNMCNHERKSWCQHCRGVLPLLLCLHVWVVLIQFKVCWRYQNWDMQHHQVTPAWVFSKPTLRLPQCAAGCATQTSMDKTNTYGLFTVLVKLY